MPSRVKFCLGSRSDGVVVELKRFMDSLACCTYNGAQHSDVLVEETDVLAKLRKVRLQVGSGDWFSFCPDRGGMKDRACLTS